MHRNSTNVSTKQERIAALAKQSPQMAFTSLAYLMDIDALDENHDLRKFVEEIKETGERATALIRQLLAFSRKQIVQQQPVDLNAVIAGFEMMLARMIGEDVKLTTSLQTDLAPIMADACQLEQITLNLAINARDAMPHGGTLILRTANVSIEGYDDPKTSHMESGRYALLSIGDTGCGMSDETLARIFEPFFTTKEQGKGTGLGLATVYGIVKHFGGTIRVDTSVGQGTTFEIYFPALETHAAPSCRAANDANIPRGWETILLVEDDDAVRDFTC